MMIFKRFFTWLGWSLYKKTWVSLVIFVALVIGPPAILFSVIPSTRHSPFSYLVMGLYFALVTFCFLRLSLIKNWRGDLDTAERKAEKIDVPEEFRLIFETLKGRTKKTQNSAELMEFMTLIEILKNEGELLVDLKRELSEACNQDWIESKVASLRKNFAIQKIQLPSRIQEQSERIYATRNYILRLLEPKAE